MRREVESRGLTLDDDAARLAVARHLVAEGDVVVAHSESHVHRLLLRVFEGHRQFVGTVCDLRTLDAVQPVVLLDGTGLLSGVGHLPAEVADVRDEAEGGVLEDSFPPVGH